MNYDPHQQLEHAFHAQHSAVSEPTVLLSPVARSAAVGLFTSANTGQLSESTQQMRWQLPEERHLHVVRGGLRRDWRAGRQVMGGLFLIGLLMLTLAHWPVHARREAVSNRAAVPAAVSAASTLTVPYAAPGERPYMPSAYRPDFQHYPYGSDYRHLRLPVPGLPDAYVSTSARPGRTNALHNGYYTVSPAAPIGIGPSVPHYSY